MRDIELEPLPDQPALPGPPPVPAVAGDDAFARKPPGGVDAAVGLVDDSFRVASTADKAYTRPSLGGEFGPGRATVVSGPADGGQDELHAGANPAPDPVVRPTPP